MYREVYINKSHLLYCPIRFNTNGGSLVPRLPSHVRTWEGSLGTRLQWWHCSILNLSRLQHGPEVSKQHIQFWSAILQTSQTTVVWGLPLEQFVPPRCGVRPNHTAVFYYIIWLACALCLRVCCCVDSLTNSLEFCLDSEGKHFTV